MNGIILLHSLSSLDNLIKYLGIIFTMIVFHIYSKKSRSKLVFGLKKLAKSNFSYTFVQETKFFDFCEGTCHYDVIEATLGMLVLILVPMFRGDSKLTICTK